MKKLLLLLVGIFTSVSLAQKTSRIIEQSQAPIKIVSYEADYQKGGKYSSKGIRHEVEYRNISKRNIVALKIGLVSFDVWNEFLNQTGGISMIILSPNETEDGTWIARAYGDFSFYTGLAYVSNVRFSNGEIWSADLDNIAKELRKVEKDFDVSTLIEKDTGD